MSLKPWHTIVVPREDLREGKPLDASEFAVHLDQVLEGSAPVVYQEPEQFFQRTFLTQNLTTLSSEVIRRLAGEKTEASSVFNMTTQFGGGKTHALTLLYHLAKQGQDAARWQGVSGLLDKAGVSSIPHSATAVFVGEKFDSITGRGGVDGEPLRRTPWGEIAYQLDGLKGFRVVEEHERQMTAPGGDVIRQFLPKDRPCLILMDELMNYVSRSRKNGMATQLYNFLHSLSEEARSRENVVLAVSIPASELEMSAEDQSDYERFKKLLDRVGKAVVMSAETETSEIIRRRLFEWDEVAISRAGTVNLTRDALATCSAYADWTLENRQQIPAWFPVDHATDAFKATYPFHPMVLSVFERKWQALPRFQQTRGALRLLALWVSHAYQEGFKGAHRDPLIGLGTAPLEDSLFRAALFEQMGEGRLETAVTTDICGKSDSHAVRLDKEAIDALKKARLHRKVATAIFFESNGGQTRTEATLPEVRLTVAEPGLDIGHVETALETLTSACYYLSVEKNRYRFSLTPNLNKLLADRRASIKAERIAEQVKAEIQKVFTKRAGSGIDVRLFPDKSTHLPNQPVMTLAVLSPENSMEDDGQARQLIEALLRDYGTSSRTFKSALIFCVPETAGTLQEDARRLLAWEDIRDEEREKLDEGQLRQLDENLRKAKRDLEESVWRTYKSLILLGKDNQLQTVDLGLIHSSAADSMPSLIINRLKQDGDVTESISPNFLVRNWPPAFKEWSTKAVRDAFFASPQFPRLLNADAVRETIARGVANGIIGYIGKSGDGYEPFWFGKSLSANEVEITDEMFVITKDTAEVYEQKQNHSTPLAVATSPTADRVCEPVGGLWGASTTSTPPVNPPATTGVTSQPEETQTAIPKVPEDETIPTDVEKQPPFGITWSGDIPSQQWMNFYMKVLMKLGNGQDVKLTLNIEAQPEGGIAGHKVEEIKTALRELGLDDTVKPV